MYPAGINDNSRVMGEIVYTNFGYGKIVKYESSIAPEPQPKEQLEIRNIESITSLPSEPPAINTNPDKIAKVEFTWGGIGYLPV